MGFIFGRLFKRAGSKKLKSKNKKSVKDKVTETKNDASRQTAKVKPNQDSDEKTVTNGNGKGPTNDVVTNDKLLDNQDPLSTKDNTPSPPSLPLISKTDFSSATLVITPKDLKQLEEKIIDAETCQKLIDICASEIRERGLETLGIFMPFRLDEDPYIIKRLVFIFFNHPEEFSSEARFTSIHNVTGAMKWSLRHLQVQNTKALLTLDISQKLFDAQAASKYSPQSFSTFTSSLPKGSRSLLNSILSLCASVASYSHINGMSGARLIKSLAFYVFGLQWKYPLPRAFTRAQDSDFDHVYKDWAAAATAFERIFLAYLYLEKAFDNKLPLHLEQLIENYPPPPAINSTTQTSPTTSHIDILRVSLLSPDTSDYRQVYTPIEEVNLLFEKLQNPEATEFLISANPIFKHLQELGSLEASCAEDNLRVLTLMSERPAAGGNSISGFSNHMGSFSTPDLHTFHSQSKYIGTIGVGTVASHKWKDFMISGFADDFESEGSVTSSLGVDPTPPATAVTAPTRKPSKMATKKATTTATSNITPATKTPTPAALPERVAAIKDTEERVNRRRSLSSPAASPKRPSSKLRHELPQDGKKGPGGDSSWTDFQEFGFSEPKIKPDDLSLATPAPEKPRLHKTSSVASTKSSMSLRLRRKQSSLYKRGVNRVNESAVDTGNDWDVIKAETELPYTEVRVESVKIDETFIAVWLEGLIDGGNILSRLSMSIAKERNQKVQSRKKGTTIVEKEPEKGVPATRWGNFALFQPHETLTKELNTSIRWVLVEQLIDEVIQVPENQRVLPSSASIATTDFGSTVATAPSFASTTRRKSNRMTALFNLRLFEKKECDSLKSSKILVDAPLPISSSPLPLTSTSEWASAAATAVSNVKMPNTVTENKDGSGDGSGETKFENSKSMNGTTKEANPKEEGDIKKMSMETIKEKDDSTETLTKSSTFDKAKTLLNNKPIASGFPSEILTRSSSPRPSEKAGANRPS